MNKIEHRQLIFIASRLGIPAGQCCEHEDLEITQKICEKCHQGCSSWVYSVHDHSQCEIISKSGVVYPCLIKRYQQRLASEKGFRHQLTNILTPFERDYLIYVLARRTNQLNECDLSFDQIISRVCELCEQGNRAGIKDIKEECCCHGECAGTSEEELAKKCWIGRLKMWRLDGYRLSRLRDYV